MTCTFCGELNNKLDDTSLIIDNREVRTFGSVVSSVLHKAVNEFRIVRIVVLGDVTKNRENYQFNREISEVMRSSHGMFVIEVIDFKKLFKTKSPTDQLNEVFKFCKGTCLLLYENLKALEVVKRMTIRIPKNNNIEFIIMFVRGASAEDVRETLQTVSDQADPYGPIIDDSTNEYTIVDAENGFYELLEINRFVGGGACDKTSMATINRFSKQKLEWEKQLQRLEVKTTFNGCGVDNELSSTQAIQNTKTTENGQVYEYSGLVIDIMNLIGEIGNFSPKCSYSFPLTADENGDGKEGLFEDEWFNALVIYVTKYIQPFHIVQLVEKEFYFVVPQGELYTEWEKLFLAFDLATWLLIVLTFAASFIAIFIINFAKQFVKNFVFGRQVTTPSLNVLKIFFGLGQTVLPRRNFARFLLALFTIWTLIIRTCYQGLLFENLVGDGRKPPIKTIDELLQRNFTYHTHESHCQHLLDTTVRGNGR